MKSIPRFLALLLIAGAGLPGCSGNDRGRVAAGSGSTASSPDASRGSAGAGMVSTDQPAQADPRSSGGSTLPASMPYTQGKGEAVSQSINPGPFLTAVEAKPAAQRGAGSTGLVSRADGTMFGLNDQPAAGIGPGMAGAPQGGGSKASNRGRGKASAGGLSAPARPSSNQTSGK